MCSSGNTEGKLSRENGAKWAKRRQSKAEKSVRNGRESGQTKEAEE